MREMAVSTLDNLHILAGDVLTEIGERAVGKNTATMLALHGELGAGKTAFVQTLAHLLGVTEQVTSPTFVIMRFYPITAHDFFKKIVHVDAYRVESLAEMDVMNFEDVLCEPANLVCIEWAERVTTVLPEDAFHITFSHGGASDSNMFRTVVYGYAT